MINVTRHGTAAPISTAGSTAVGRARPGRLGATTVALLVLLVIGLVQAMPAQAADPQSVSFNLDGCDLTQSGADPASYDPDSGDFVCNDPAYVGGNLGKGWEELDLVPYRFTATARNNAPLTQTYTISVLVDREDAGKPGYDDLSAPVLNTAKSDAGCNAPVVGAKTILAPGLGGIDKSLYRFVTITQPRGTECVYDYYARLAVGSHLFPGSSLHANLANENLNTSGIGAEDRSIPVKEIQPQTIAKDMSATRNADHIWSVKKSPTPAELDFTNTCNSTALSAQVQIKVEWERLAASPSGDVTILTHIYATNPADRIITINVTDNVYEGTGQTTLVGTKNSGDIDVPKNTAGFPVMTHMFTVSNAASHFNDVATATYKDLVTGVPVPGQTTASAGADVQAGTTTNTSATITDVESISGAGFSYSVDSFSGASGSFSGGYLAGTKTTGDVTWVSGSQTGNGSATFNKTVYVAGPQIGNGSLSDVATLNASDGFTANANAAVALTADAKVALRINKTIPNVLGQGEMDTFTFLVTGPDGYSQPVVLSFSAGETSESSTLTGLAPGSYTVDETGSTSGNWNLQPDKVVDLSLPTCSDAVTFNNTYTPAIARVKKVTVPVGTSSGWVFQLVRTDLNPDVVVDTETIAAGAVFDGFDGDLVEGTYEIRETGGPAGYDLTDVTGGAGVNVVGNVCAFTVDYVANAGDVFDCTFENTQEGRIEIEKQTLPAGSPATFGFTGDLTATLSDNGVDGKAVDPGQLHRLRDEQDGLGPDGHHLRRRRERHAEHRHRLDRHLQRGARRDRPLRLQQPAGRPDRDREADTACRFAGDVRLHRRSHGHPQRQRRRRQGRRSRPVHRLRVEQDGLGPDGHHLRRRRERHAEHRHRLDRHLQRGARRDRPLRLQQPAGRPDRHREADAACQLAGVVRLHRRDHHLARRQRLPGKDVDPGQYTVSETAEAGWDLTSIQCNDGASATPSTGTGSTATFNVEPGETVRCVFNNRQEGRIVIEKQTLPANSPESFDYTGEITTSLVDNGSQGKDVDPGQYTVSETAEAGWDLTSIQCNDGASATPSTGTGSTATFNVDPGETVSCVFNNTQRGKIIVEKQTNPDGAAGNFTFTGTAVGTISDNGTIEVPNLVPGTYYSTEGDPTPNFDLTDIICDDGQSLTPSSGSVATRKATFKLDPGETVKCTFTNTQRGMAKVIKTTSGGPVTQPQGSGFVFQLRSGAVPAYPGGAGTILESGEANAGNGGVIPFTTKLVPGDTYQLCEIIMPGWMTSLVGFVPNSVGNPVVDNSPICVNFTVTAGQTTEISVDNTPPPGGRALTIGFWKNWASCSGGKQKPVLDQTLAGFPIAAGKTLPGVYIGDLYVDTCLEAVRILNKSTVNTGAKKASDPAFNLAAQLLAAKLNLQAGAGVCPAAVMAIDKAQLKLANLDFNGITHLAISSTLATTLNNLATTIDDYNNNELC